MRFRRNNDENEKIEAPDVEYGVDLSSDLEPEAEPKSPYGFGVAEAEPEPASDEREAFLRALYTAKGPAPELPIVSIAESIVVGVANGYQQFSEPTGRSLSLFMDGNKAVLTVYDAEGDYRHIRLDSSHRQMLQSWLDQAAS
ncbi:MAG TPA: hypothetical protein VGH54_23955 [Mycobacterium sp.]|jgi:hypothetical protein|uniref:hypothetical protein n=1 Tax=Mycobacterium sp. TaxID=1785 RepID=UPI002F401BBD